MIGSVRCLPTLVLLLAAPHVVEAVAELLESEGSVMSASGVNPKVEKIINSLHTRAWSRYGHLESVVQFVVGGGKGASSLAALSLKRSIAE